MLFALALCVVLLGGLAEAATPILSCYYTNWAQYRPDPMKFFPEDIDPFMCTHIMYAFADLKNNHLTPFEYNDDDFTDGTPGMYTRVNNLKAKNPDLKVSLAVGGWNMGSGPFITMVETKETRADFISHSIGFLRDRNFDGLDLDWEYPSGVYKDKFTLLVQELRVAYNAEGTSTGRPPLLITAATPAGEGTLNYAYDVGAVSKELDFFNIMTYDMAGSWDPFVGHHTNLYSAPEDTGNLVAHVVDYVTKDYIRRGCPKEKVVVGCATYGRSFRLSGADNMPGAPSSGGASPGDFTKQGGIWSQYEICDRIDNGFTERWDGHRKVPHAYSATEWVGYENPDSITLKAEYILANNLGGAMVWALDLDDFKGYYCTNAFPGTGAWSIMTELKRGLHGDNGSPPPTGGSPPTPPQTTAATQPTQPPPVTTQPSGDFSCTGRPNGCYEDPKSCNMWYECWSGNKYHNTCTPGLYFNIDFCGCDWPDNVKCP
ncbi:chitinase-3-like protein 1 [Amphiura filiformis]|uniref:chitinase-3-like protein 1 n=1 Tax=Amphiura filiformis TaxID=82378 RepID=UPI003B20D20F